MTFYVTYKYHVMAEAECRKCNLGSFDTPNEAFAAIDNTLSNEWMGWVLTVEVQRL
jgi:hypothetical protein